MKSDLGSQQKASAESLGVSTPSKNGRRTSTSRRSNRLRAITADIRFLSEISIRSHTSLARSSISNSLQSGSSVPDQAAAPFLGAWTPVSSERYKEFLQEALGLGWSKASIGARISPKPRFDKDANGHLRCTTCCFGAKDVEEVLLAGEGEFFEPNLGITYNVTAKWETLPDGGAVFVSSRHSKQVNNDVPTVQKRWVEAATDQLVIEQDWGKSYKFVARYARAPPA